MVVQGKLDGFFLPYDLMALIPTLWPDQVPVSIYRSTRGFLAFRPTVFIKYGFRTEARFARAVLFSEVPAETIPEAFSLGPVRQMKGRPWRIRLSSAGQTWPLEILVQDESEAESLRVFLAQHLASSVPQIAMDQGPRWFWPCLPPWTELRRSWGGIGRQKQVTLFGLILMIIGGVAIVGLSLFSVIPWYLDYPALAGGLIILWRLR
jgi:hypothetical protein